MSDYTNDVTTVDFANEDVMGALIGINEQVKRIADGSTVRTGTDGNSLHPGEMDTTIVEGPSHLAVFHKVGRERWETAQGLWEI